MKIVSLECFHVRPETNLLKITTDTGLCGWGEPVAESRPDTVAKAVDEFARILVGEDPLKIEHLWQLMYRTTFYKGGVVLVSAMSGIEQALWDLKGKYYNMPVYEMLGGRVRDKVRMITSLRGGTPEELAENAKLRVSQGYTAVKVDLAKAAAGIEPMSFVRSFTDRIKAVREAVGPEVDVAADLNGLVSPAMSRRMMKALEPYYPMFAEEPCLPENIDALELAARSTTIPIATGERVFTRFGFREILEKGAAVILQPDLCHAGGIFEVRKIAAMAEPYYASVAPHSTPGAISLAACLAVDACTPNFLIQEHAALEDGSDLGEGFLKAPFRVEGGYITVPEGPGLGIEVDEDRVRAAVGK